MSKRKRIKRIKTIIRCSLLLLGLYYLLPLLGMALSPIKGEAFLQIGLIQIAYPLYLYISAIYLGTKYGFCSLYAVVAAVAFFPTLLIYFNPQIWMAGLIYGAITLGGNLMGWGLRSLWKRMQNM